MKSVTTELSYGFLYISMYDFHGHLCNSRQIALVVFAAS